MIPLFSIGPFTFYFFGLMIVIGAFAGIFFIRKESKRRGLNSDLLVNGLVYSLIGGIIGARIVYIFIYNPSYYFSNPSEIFHVNEGGLSIHGGLAGGILIGYLFLRRHKFPIWKTLDIVAPGLILAQGISRIGCDVFGGPISEALPWGIEVNGEYLHPAQAYEFILDYLLFGYLWIKSRRPSYSGQVFLHYLIGFMLIRAIVEFVRINPMVFGFFSVSHIMSLIGIIVGGILIVYRKNKGKEDTINNIQKMQNIKTSIIVFLLIIVSLTIYYLVQS